MDKANENKVKYVNIKQLSVSSQNDIPELIKNIKDAKKQLDNIFKQIKDKEQVFIAKNEEASASAAIKNVSEVPAVEESVKEESPISALKDVENDNKGNIIIDKTADLTPENITEDKEVLPAPFKEEKKFGQIVPEQNISEKEEIKESAPISVHEDKEKPIHKAKSDALSKPKKAKTAEEKFMDSLPKPVNSENKRIINLAPEKPKVIDTNIKRYTNPDRTDYNRTTNRPYTPRPAGSFTGTGTGSGYGSAPYQNNVQRSYPPRTGGFTPSNNYAPNRRPGQSSGFTPVTPLVDLPKENKNSFNNIKKKTPEKDSDKKVMNKRTLLKRGFETDPTLTGEEYKMGSKKFKIKKKEEEKVTPMPKIEKAFVNIDIIPLKILSDKLGITAAEITKKLFKDGVIKTINESIDFETAALMAADLGIELELKLDKTAEDTLALFHEEEKQNDPNMIKRPPVVTIMGHVDHGKTSLLDAIKHTNVAAGEAGGITQHIGAYTIKINGEQITFIDTPGHEAFTAMRARGASITDIAILVVAADDGIMPQTIEAINHIKAAKVPLIVAVNKMDKPTANVERVKQQLTEQGIVPEEWGGDAIICPVSAVTKVGIDHLLEMILLVAELKELKANPDRKARGTVIEAKLDKGKGPVATILVQNGTLRVGDNVVAGNTSGRIRAMLDEKGRSLKEAGPSIAVAVLGFSDVPNAGDPIFAVDDEKLSRMVAQERINKIKFGMVKSASKVTLDDIFSKIAEGQIKGLNIIIKGDVQGSVEAVSQALIKLSNAEVKVNIMHGGVGAITESDVMLAQTASAIIIGFNVRPDTNAKQLAAREKVDIRLYRIIYEVIDAVGLALKGMLTPKFKEVILGQAQVRMVYKITGAGTIAGSYVTSGKILRSSKIRLLRDNVVVIEGQISSLKRFKDDVKEVAQNFECGISIENFSDIKENDIIECFQMEEIIQA